VSAALNPLLRDAAQKLLAAVEEFQAAAPVFQHCALQHPGIVRTTPPDIPNLQTWENFCLRIIDPQ